MLINQSQPQFGHNEIGESNMTNPTIQTNMHSPIDYKGQLATDYQPRASVVNGSYNLGEQFSKGH